MNLFRSLCVRSSPVIHEVSRLTMFVYGPMEQSWRRSTLSIVTFELSFSLSLLLALSPTLYHLLTALCLSHRWRRGQFNHFSPLLSPYSFCSLFPFFYHPLFIVILSISISTLNHLSPNKLIFAMIICFLFRCRCRCRSRSRYCCYCCCSAAAAAVAVACGVAATALASASIDYIQNIHTYIHTWIANIHTITHSCDTYIRKYLGKMEDGWMLRMHTYICIIQYKYR